MDIALKLNGEVWRPHERIHPESSLVCWTESSDCVLQVNSSSPGVGVDGPAVEFGEIERHVGVFVDRTAMTPLTGGDIHSHTVIVHANIGVDLPPEYDDDGLARRTDAWSDPHPGVVNPLSIRDSVPVRSGD